MTNFIGHLGCHFAEIIKGEGFFVVSGRGCPTHTGSRHVVPGCPLHHYLPRDDEIISLDRRVQRQAPGTTYVEVSSPEESPTATPWIPSAPNTPESTPTRPKSPSPFSWEAIFARSNYRRAHGWDESDSNSSSEGPPENDTFYTFSQSPPPSPTESEFDWPTRPSAGESSSPSFDDMDIDIDDFNPEDYVDFDYGRPPLCVPGWFIPSDDLQPTHWCDMASAREAEAWAAIVLDAALERVTETTAILATARAAAEEADLHVYNTSLRITVGARFMRSREYLSMLDAVLDMATGEARDAAEAVKAAAAEAARAIAAARAAGANIDDDSDIEDDTFDNGLPWSSGGSWSIVNELDTLGETQEDYGEH